MTPRPSDRYIPWYIVLFFVAQTVLFGWFTYIAETTHTGLVTEQAYEKGLHYNKTIEKERLQKSLGLTSSVTHNGSNITFKLQDKNGANIMHAIVTLWLYRPTQDGKDIRVGMTETSTGEYTATVGSAMKGLWEIRIHALTDTNDYQTSQRVVFE